MFAKRPRDENGWRIPAEGTMSRRVYDMLKAGKSIAEIRAATCGFQADAHVRSIQNPDYRRALTKKRRISRYQARQALQVDDAAKISQRLAEIDRERASLLEKQKEARLLKDVEAWIERTGMDMALRICRRIWPDDPAYSR